MIMIDNDKVVRHDPIPGLIAKSEEKDGKIYLDIKIKKNHYVETKICFGVSYDMFEQKVIVNLELEENAKALLLSQCLFPHVSNVSHTMEGKFRLRKNAELVYLEEHIHSDNLVKINSKINVKVEEGGLFRNEFKLIEGRAGEIKVDYTCDLEENARAVMDLKLKGVKDDLLDKKEKIILRGDGSAGIIKSNVVLRDSSKSKILNVTEAYGEGRGHVECNEILMDNATAETIPKLISHNPNAKLTHEASIGKIDEKQILVLMSKGLSKEEAVSFIINKMLK